MYKGLWTLIERHADEESAAGLYLAGKHYLLDGGNETCSALLRQP